jgi:hypothetical protein
MVNPVAGKASPDIPAFKPYRGKPAVRNFRGGDGDVGIIRSPVRAIALPDNRHAVEDERALQERKSDSILASSLAEAVARLPSKRRQRNQRAGYGAAVCPEKEREKADVFSGR